MVLFLVITQETVIFCSNLTSITSHQEDFETIPFVVANRGECSFSIPSTASVVDLHRTVVETCNVSPAVEVQLLGETIAHSQSDPNQRIADISSIPSIVREMQTIWGRGYRIPIKLRRPLASSDDWAVYSSLCHMFNGSELSVYSKPWYHFARYCLASHSCLIQDICDRFEKSFHCVKGQLITINLLGQRVVGYLDLTVIPQTVKKILMQRNHFTEIIGLDQLAGNEVRILDLRGNPVEIDLNLLTPSDVSNHSLKVLRFNLNQVSRSLVGKYCHENYKGDIGFCEEVYQAIMRWMGSTALDLVVVGRQHPKRIRRQTSQTLLSS